MVVLPLRIPDSMPTETMEPVCGMRTGCHPCHIKETKPMTTAAIATRIGAAGRLASASSPTGVPITTPADSGAKEGQSICFQTCGSSQPEAITSNSKTTGTTSAGGRTSVRLTVEIIENPNPL